MNILNSLSTYIWGGEGQGGAPQILVQLQGKFYDNKGPKGSWRCLVMHATASVHRTSQFVCTLQVVPNEAEEGDESVDVKTTIEPSLSLARVDGPCGPGIAFNTPQGTRMIEYEENNKLGELFINLLCRCTYEYVNKRPAEDAVADEDFDVYCTDGIEGPTENTIEPVDEEDVVAPAQTKATFSVPGSVVLNTPGDLYIYNEEAEQFNSVETHVIITITDVSTPERKYDYALYLHKAGEEIIGQELANNMHPNFAADSSAFNWITLGDEMLTWRFVFPSQRDQIAFKEVFLAKLWEAGAKKEFGKIKKEDADWVLGAYEDDVDMGDDDGLTDDDMMDFSDEEDEDFDYDENTEKNTLLAVGQASDRAFVARGSKLGVFSVGDSLDYKTTIENVVTPQKVQFRPKDMMLHKQDTDMLFLHPTERKSVFRMDLTRGDVVDEWKTDGQVISTIVPESKFAQSSDTQTLVGINNTGFFVLDPRVPGSKVVKSRNFQYARNPKFACASTTEQGHLAVGSSTGEIRLFSNKSMQGDSFSRHEARLGGGITKAPRAKTSLPGCGDPIVGIDVTSDGSWILATCQTYLLIVPAELANGQSGFTRGMGKNKPIPRRLQLKREHIAMMGGHVSFTPAKFNIGQMGERSIVTSTGKFVITWNFRKVKQNVLDQYQIKKYQQEVVADHFKSWQDRDVVVAMPDDVRLAKRHKGVVKNWD